MIFLTKSILRLIPKSSCPPCPRLIFRSCGIKMFSPGLPSKSIFSSHPALRRSISSVDSPNSHADENTKPTFCERLVKSSGPLEPYFRLIRLHNPTGDVILFVLASCSIILTNVPSCFTGCWLLFWPFGWSIALAALPADLPDIKSLIMFGSMAFIMRGAGCTINDMWDKEIDRNVICFTFNQNASNKD